MQFPESLQFWFVHIIKGICMLVPSLILRCGPDASSQAWTKDHIDMIYDVDESLVRAA